MTEEPVHLLLACHERIRRFCAGLVGLADLPDLQDPRAQPTARACHTYFSSALLLHAQDEELSMLPRLQGLLDATAVAAIETMQAEHERIDAELAQVLTGLDSILLAEPIDFAQSFGDYSALLLAHIAAEEALIFSSIAKIPSSERQQMVLEFRARRTALLGTG